MKKLKILTALLLTFIGSLISITKVNAAETDKIKREGAIPGPYYITHFRGTHYLWDEMHYIVRASDGALVYCIQPLVNINSDSTYEVSTDDVKAVAAIGYDEWKRIEKIAYYGYGYKEGLYDHTDERWVAATQMLIWKIADKTVTSYFSKTLKGPEDPTILKAEMEEINYLVDNHNKTPNLSGIPNEVIINNQFTLEDTNGVLSEFDITNVKGAMVTKNGNILSITPTEVGELSFEMIKQNNRYGEPIYLYYAVDSQTAARRGNIDPLKATFKVNVTGPRISITKKDPCGNIPIDASLEGAIYGIYDSSGNKVTEMVTDKNGSAISEYLPSLGTYYIQEIKASNNYLLDKTKYEVEFTSENIADNMTIHIDVIENRKAKISLTKIDSDTNTAQGEATLKGAVYEIYDLNGNIVSTMTTDENGIAISEYLPNRGIYTIKEIKAPEGYNLDPNIYTINLEDEDTCYYIPVTSKEKVITNTYEFTKLYAKADTGFMTPEVGAKFAIYNSKNEKVGEYITDADGKFKIVLPYGSYTLKQLSGSYGFNLMDDYRFVIKEQINNTIYKNITNSEITAKLKVIKIDAVTKEVIKLSGIKFKIFSLEKNEYVCQTVTYPSGATYCEFETDVNGEFTTPYNLESGKYVLEEVDQAIDGYLWNNRSHEFTIDENSNLRTDSEYGITFDIRFENTPVMGEVIIEKIGEVAIFTDKGYIFDNKPLEGIIFELCAEEDIIYNGQVIIAKGTRISEKKTDKNGKIVFDNLYLGKYFIKEKETLNAYVLDDKKYSFELKYKDQYTPVITYKTTILNALKTGKLEFTKTDFTESELLPNTLIEIYTSDDILIFSGRTDMDGKIVIDRIPQGKYYILEKEAPKGYLINTEKMWFEIKENGEIIKSLMKDEKIIDIPNTYLSDYKIMIVSGITLMSIGIGAILYEIKKKKE